MQTINEIRKAHKEHRLLIRKKDRTPCKREIDGEWFRPTLWKPGILPNYETLIFDSEDSLTMFLLDLKDDGDIEFFEDYGLSLSKESFVIKS